MDKPAVLLFHGLASNPKELAYIAQGLRVAGYYVVIPELKGYTHTLLNNSEYGDWTNLALDEFDKVAFSHKEVVVGGLCIGALLALHVAQNRKVHKILALSTTLYYDSWGNHWAKLLLPLHPFIPFSGKISIRERSPYGVKNIRLRELLAKQMKRKGVSRAGASRLLVSDIYEARQLAKDVEANLSKITAPILILHAEEDEITTLKSAYTVMRKVSSKIIRCTILTNSYHMISIDNDKWLVVTEILDFLRTKNAI
ncbi:MAG: Thermostable monoacylglycerol lipase [Parcubacteria group bacterium ADurb.Bin216]|nr:MAG: Thermostable monoacylglycerol lipase [Parcubacteria group bacterium ADurb.Bin216]